MIRKGYLHRLRRGVFAVGHLALGDEARRRAAVDAAGEGAALTRISAGIWWEILTRSDRIVEVVVPRQRRPVTGGHLFIDRRLPPDAVVLHRNVPVLTPTWTIVSLADRLGAGDLTRVMREASYRRLLRLDELVRICEGHERRAGIRTLRKAIELRMSGSSGYASRLERDVNRYVRAKVDVAPIMNVTIAGLADEYEVDMVWPDIRVCCEIDGPIHDDPDVRREDERRTADLQAAGWIVVRIHWSAWKADPGAAVAELLEFVTTRR